MSKPATGTVVWANNKWYARITLPSGKRQLQKLPLPAGMAPLTKADKSVAQQFAAALSQDVRVRPVAPIPPTSETYAQWSVRWLEDRVNRGFFSVRNDRGRMHRYILPAIGPKAILEITRADIEDVVTSLDNKVRANEMAGRTALHVWSLLKTSFDDAVNSKNRSLKLLQEDPTARVRGPDRVAPKSKQFLWPAEFLKFVSCVEVPRYWRQLVTIAVYTYMRDAEIAALEVADIHLAEGYILVHQTVERARIATRGSLKRPKTKRSRTVPIEPELRPLLEYLIKTATGPRLLPMPGSGYAPTRIRALLPKAGVTRRELFKTTDSSNALTFHDLRATGITWKAIRGDAPIAIMVDAGHSSFKTTELYIRAARSMGGSPVAPFPPLPAELCGPSTMV